MRGFGPCYKFGAQNTHKRYGPRMVQDFLFEHFLKVNNKDKDNSQLLAQTSENTNVFDLDELNNINELYCKNYIESQFYLAFHIINMLKQLFPSSNTKLIFKETFNLKTLKKIKLYLM